jgi:hypothetical protein
MKNPWSELPTVVPYVLPCDIEVIKAFNSNRPEDDQIHLTPIPEPFLGRRNAKLVLLNLNPRYSPENLGFYGWRCPLVKAARMNLVHEDLPYPFWTLHPGFRYYGGFNWWRRKLKALIDECERDSELVDGAYTVARNTLCVEYFPYHSSGSAKVPHVESQRYLVHRAMKRGAVIVIMRSEKRWFRAVKGLEEYHPICLTNVQNPTITLKNCNGDEAKWKRIVMAAKGE